MSLGLKIRSLFRRRLVEQELDDEVLFHFEQQVAENLAAGMGRAAAEQAARRTIGGVASIKDEWQTVFPSKQSHQSFSHFTKE